MEASLVGVAKHLPEEEEVGLGAAAGPLRVAEVHRHLSPSDPRCHHRCPLCHQFFLQSMHNGVTQENTLQIEGLRSIVGQPKIKYKK